MPRLGDSVIRARQAAHHDFMPVVSVYGSWKRPHPAWLLLSILGGVACSAESKPNEEAAAGTSGVDRGGSTATAGGKGGGGATATAGAGDAPGQGGSAGETTGTAGSGGVNPALPASVTVHLVPQDGVTGAQRVNFAVPLAPGQLTDQSMVRVLDAGAEVPAYRRGLASYADGSLRSVQIQVDVMLSGEADVEVLLGESPTSADLEAVPVEDTLVDPSSELGPRVWALLPAAWLSGSGFAGPLLPEADVADQPSAAWAALCDYEANGLDTFLTSGYESDRAVWLFDRGTALYRGYARRGDLGPLRSAYIETAMYRNLITGSGVDTRNGVPPDGAEDVKYAYSQNLALHYLLSGDDRFRESAENMALGMSALWPDPGYAGGDDFWTERHAGFGLLAYVWAAIVSDDQADAFKALADEAVTAYLEVQATYPPGYADQAARCFAHTGNAHGEGGDYFGCSPWMSAILADGLVQYARESAADRAAEVEQSLIALGRIIAQRGIQPDGRPYYFMGVDTDQNMLEEYDEHYGESAYLIAMSWALSGKSDDDLRAAADALVAALADNGSAPHIRSFNWQCRSSVAAPWYLQ